MRDADVPDARGVALPFLPVQNRLLRLVNADVEAWMDDVRQRLTRDLSTSEFLKAVRALSARYVERRDTLGRRSAADSSGKRAAFAAFFAPLHFLTTQAVVREIGAAGRPLETIVDLGCGTGVVSAAWALAFPRRPRVIGVDREGWALDEAARTWRAFGVEGRTKRGDIGRPLSPLASPFLRHPPATGIVLGWSANELTAEARTGLLPELLALAERGASVLVIEPIARTAVPWWDDWSETWTRAGGRSDLWKLDEPLPASLAALSESAGFRRDALTARTLWR
jgi:hypothetical protein